MDYQSLINFQLPNPEVFKFSFEFKPFPESPFNGVLLNKLYQYTLQAKFPIFFAFVYFISVHLINKFVVRPRHGVATSISKTHFFQKFVLLHNIALCVYSIWTFIGMTYSIYQISHLLKPVFVVKKSELFWQSICNLENGIWSQTANKGLLYYSFWFYISKFYEVIDTIIILLKGRPSSLLQSYHHAGAMLSMWSGVRFQSPPIWVFVVFNSFIHSIMYAYFTLSCLHIRVPKLFKQILTSMQILQFILGGSLLVFHLFVEYYDHLTGSFKSCIADSNQAMLLWINVIYLTPLTMLFGAFWIESYVKKNQNKLKKL